MLADDGVLVIENHYLLDILEKNQFDSIYHEHIRTYTLQSLIMLFDFYDLQLFDVERVARYGGNIRAYVGRPGKHKYSANVRTLLSREEDAGLYGWQSWDKFLDRVLWARHHFQVFMKDNPTGVKGCSAPGRASTLLNWYGADWEWMGWTGEIDGSLKIGKRLPGSHIPVVANRHIIETQPEYLVLLAWHYGTEIEARLRKEGVKSKLILPLPEFTIRDQIGMAA